MKHQNNRAEKRRPFSLTPDPDFFYLSCRHQEALSCLEDGLRKGMELQVMTGAPGLGKTTLLHALAKQLGGAILPVFLSLDRIESETDFFREVCHLLSIPFQGKSVTEMEEEIHRFAHRQGKKRKTVLLLLDEADELDEPLRRSVLRFARGSREKKKHISMILAGPPVLESRMTEAAALLQGPGLPSACLLREMPPVETIRYILYRLSVVGSGPERSFSAAALRLILHGSGGIPRMINVICAGVMDICYATGKWPAEESAVQEALRDLDLEREGDRKAKPEPLEEIEQLLETALSREREARPRRSSPSAGKTPSRPRPEGAPASKKDSSTQAPPRGRAGSPQTFSLADAGRFLAWFLFVTALLGGGTLWQVLDQKKEVSEAKTRLREQRLGAPAPDRGAVGSPPAPARHGREEEGFSEDPLDRYMKEQKDRIRAQLEEMEIQPQSAGEPAQTFQDRDLASIIMDHFGKLDREILEAFMRKNPHVNNWNALGRTSKLTLPDLEDISALSQKRGVDIHTIRVGSYDSRGAAHLAAKKLNRAGFQNLFVTVEIHDAGKGRRYDLCTGVFVSEPNAAENIPWMKQSGFPEARPTRIREESLGRVLHLFQLSPPSPS